MRKRFAALASVALLGWLLAFALHIHLPEEHPAGKSKPPHPCLVCAAFQPAAGPASMPPVAQRDQPEWASPPEPSSPHSVAFIAAYRSRAPPSA